MDLSGIITKTIAELPSEENRPYIGASGIGNKCARAIWYAYHGAESMPIAPSLKTTFDIGNRLESMLLDYMEKSGLYLVRNKALTASGFSLFRGHCDAILLLKDEAPSIVEIKTANTASFSQFKSKGLFAWRENYYAQLQAYMGMSGYKRGVLLAIDKNTSELHHEWVNYDDVYYHELLAKAKAIADSEEPPERINKNPIFFICNQCSYRKICHAE